MAINKHVRFYIRNKKGTTPQPIYLSFYIDKLNRLFYPTGVKVHPKHWDSKMDKVKNVAMPEMTVDNKHVHEIAGYQQATKDNVNLYFSYLRTVVDKALSDALVGRISITKEYLEKALDDYNNPVIEPDTISFFQFIEKFINDLETGKRMLDGNKIADPKTVQRYKTAKNSLIEFEKHEQIKIMFDSWTEELWNTYISYLTFVKNFRINNIGFYQKQVKILLKAARKAKLYTVGDWLDDVKILAENPVDVYLNKKELALIEEKDLTGNERLDRVRDLFLIGCYTGFRISDWKQVKKSNIRITEAGNHFIEIFPEKGNATPPSTNLYPVVSRILDKYQDVLPTISEQKFNEYIKELCKLVGIKDEVTTRYIIAGRVKVEKFEKHTQISSHTARRSFATNMYLDGVEPYLIMKATGHSSAANFKKYLKLDNSGAVDAIADHKSKKS
ncbi:tyrosine-type recombinase/integrase [Dyadobacter subterraneus]|uniref:Tyrosine-type recombinase/integrase n=1 Tax=Dyadobacter subterraneus TaxID=2773304 RepID=A0ABR9WGT3_9BACT|nr:site-specific integrase [Dyadobacter subterraneus]MBE9464715.1 tyrosine-type recombinase/integrase [Dyadobacter subterraneus]